MGRHQVRQLLQQLQGRAAAPPRVSSQIPSCPPRAPPAGPDPVAFPAKLFFFPPLPSRDGPSVFDAKPPHSQSFLPRLLSSRAINKHAHPSRNVSSLKTFLATASPPSRGGLLPPAPATVKRQRRAGAHLPRSRAGTQLPMRSQRETRRSSRRRLLGRRGVIAEPDRHRRRAAGGARGAAGQRGRPRRRGWQGGGGAGCTAPLFGTARDSLKTSLRRCRGNRKS